RARRADRRTVGDHPHRTARDRPRCAVRRRGGLGGRADRGLPHRRAPGVPHGAVPSPLRTRRLARDHGDHPLLAAHRDRLGARAGPVLRRIPQRGRLMTPARPVPDVTDLSAATVLVAGAGVTGVDAAQTLVEAGAAVTVVDSRAPGGETGAQLAALGVTVVDPDTAQPRIPAADLVVTSPGWRPDNPLARAAAQAGVPVW